MKTVSFYDKIYEAVGNIPYGRVATYGQVASIAGNPRAARAVGNALHKNPLPGIIPCHRVVNASGRLSPAFAFGGENAQRKLLEKEGVQFLENGFVDLKHCLWIIEQYSIRDGV